MCDSVLFDYLNNIEEEIKYYIKEYFYQLSGKEIIFLKHEIREDNNLYSSAIRLDNPEYLIKYILEHKSIYPKKIDKLLEKLENKFLDFNVLLNIFRFLYFSYHSKDGNKEKIKSNYLLNFVDSLSQEIKNTRNLIISGSELITDELIQRFFESVYFFFKYIKFPKYDKAIESDFLRKELPMAIRCAMKINLAKDNAFKLGNCQDYNEIYVKKEREGSLKYDKAAKYNYLPNLEKKEIEYLLKENRMEKLIDFKIDILKNKIEYKDEAGVKSINVHKPNQINYANFNEFGENNENNNNKKNKEVVIGEVSSTYLYPLDVVNNADVENKNMDNIFNTSKSN